MDTGETHSRLVERIDTSMQVVSTLITPAYRAALLGFGFDLVLKINGYHGYFDEIAGAAFVALTTAMNVKDTVENSEPHLNSTVRGAIAGIISGVFVYMPIRYFIWGVAQALARTIIDQCN